MVRAHQRSKRFVVAKGSAVSGRLGYGSWLHCVGRAVVKHEFTRCSSVAGSGSLPTARDPRSR